MGIQGTIKDWRKEMLAMLDSMESMGTQKVEWSSANDVHVCNLCRQRDGKTFSIKEMREILKTEFCKPGDPDDRCRCTLLAAVED